MTELAETGRGLEGHGRVRAFRERATAARARGRVMLASARARRFTLAAPALAGVALLSAGLGGIVQSFAGTGGVWCALTVAGLFCLRFDARH